jgi:hypothetical protein
MKTTLIKMPIVSYRRIENPFEQEGKRMYVAVIQAKNLSRDLDEWRKINPRDPSTTSGVAKKITKSFKDSPRSFFFKNRGITLLVEKASFDNDSKELSLEFSNEDIHGMLDGGHTYKIITKTIDSLDESEKKDLDDAHVRLEILEGFSDSEDVVDIVEARNTSTQVKDQSIEDLLGHFDSIKEILKNEKYADRVAYKEIELTEDGSKKDIDVKEILSYLICFDVEAFDSKKHPIIAYSGKGAVLSHVKENRDRLKKYLPLLPQILKLRDEIYKEMPETYNSVAEGKFGLLTGVVALKNKKKASPVELPFINSESFYSIPDGFIYPVLASFRNLVSIENDKCSWKRDPSKFFSEIIKDDLVQRIVDQAKTFSNPNKLGKHKDTWRSCYDSVAMEVLKLNI